MGPRMILVAYDGSPSADDAIDDLRTAGLPLRGMAAVLSVADTGVIGDLDERAQAIGHEPERQVFLSQQMSRIQREAVESAIELALAGAKRLRRLLPEWHVDALVMTAHPVAAIVRAARDCFAEVIIVGTHGRSAIERVLLGSISSGVAAAAHCPVRLGRSRVEFGDVPPRIVVGIDRATTADDVLRAVAVRDWPLGAAVHIVADESAEPDEQTAESEGALDTLARSSGRLQASLVRLGWSGLEPTVTVVEGSIEAGVIEAANRWGADLVVIGADDADADIRIATRTSCSVEIVRPLRISSLHANDLSEI